MAFTVWTIGNHPRDMQKFDDADRYEVIEGGALKVRMKDPDQVYIFAPGYWLWVDDDTKRPPGKGRSAIVV